MTRKKRRIEVNFNGQVHLVSPKTAGELNRRGHLKRLGSALFVEYEPLIRVVPEGAKKER